jgi:phage tail P2-like protein
LPALAWARSVDRWDLAWSEPFKRSVIANAWDVHQHKGTVAALRRIIEQTGYLLDVVEWWQEEPVGERGTFRLDVSVLDIGITDDLYAELERLITDAKPLTRHLSGISIGLESRGGVHIGAVTYLGEELTIYPWTPAEISISAMTSFAGADHTIDTMSVYP